MRWNKGHRVCCGSSVASAVDVPGSPGQELELLLTGGGLLRLEARWQAASFRIVLV